MPKRASAKSDTHAHGRPGRAAPQGGPAMPDSSRADAGFISGPARVHIGAARLDMSEIVCERFDLKRCLENRGGHLVCLAHDRVENRDVALKVERKRGGVNEEGGTSLEREALIGRFLPDHAHVLTLYQLYYLPGVDGQRLVMLTMEYADGGSLRQWLHQQTVWDQQTRAAGWLHFRSLCMGVSALHEQGIKHLDLKPENTLLCAGVAKVADFGAASISGPALDTKGGAAIPPGACSSGTPCYMSPEQFTARSVDELTEASDIYSLGVILFEILNPAHRPPFVGSYKRLCRLHQAAPIPELPDLHEAEAEILRCCMAKDPRDRFDSVEQLLEAVDTVLTVGLEAQSEDPPEGPTGEASPPSGVASEGQRGAREDAAAALYEEVLREMERGDLDEMLELAAKAAELCPTHPQAQVVNTRLAHRVKAFTDNLAACRSECEEGHPESALLFAQQAAAAHPKSVLAAQLVARVSRQIESVGQLRSEMTSAAAAGNFERALQLAEQLDDMGVPPEPRRSPKGATV